MYDYILIGYMIIMSGTALGWSLLGGTMQQIIIALLAVVFYALRTKKIGFTTKNIKSIIAIYAILFINIIVTSGVMHVITCYSMFITFIYVFIVTETMTVKRFSQVYTNLMCILAVLSVFFWFMAQIGITFAEFNIIADNGKAYRMNWFYIYRVYNDFSGLGALSPRNSGIFWEPGAYQGYLNLAILFQLFVTNASNKEDRGSKRIWVIKLSVLILTVLSAQSTTGYIILVMIAVVYYFSKMKIGKVSAKQIILAVLLVCISLFLLNSNVVRDKFNDEDSRYASTTTRMNDNINGFKAIWEEPVLGLGFNSQQYTDVLASYGIYANSSGILMVLQQFGIFIGTIILVRVFKRMCDTFELKGWGTFFFFVTTAILFSTEVFINKPLYMIFFFAFRRERENYMDNAKSVIRLKRN